MSLAATLWQANADWARKILAHRFVQGLGDGTVRISVGLEDVEDVIADLVQALG